MKQILLGVSITALLFSCTGEKKEQNNTTTDTTKVSSDTNSQASAGQVQQTVDFVENLPSPLHVSRIFKKSGLKYVSGLTNKPDAVSTYQSNTGKSLNLGVYSADLAYTSLNSQTQESVKYFKSIKGISDGLNMGSIFTNNQLIARFEKNLGNQDSLIRIMAELQMESDMLLKETQRYDVVFLSFTGAWVESMYLASQINDKQANPDLAKRMGQQAATLSKLVKLLDGFKTEVSVQNLITDLSAIQVSLDKLVEGDKPATDPAFQKHLKEDFTPKIVALRKRIISEA
jgi:hypothetical protein